MYTLVHYLTKLQEMPVDISVRDDVLVASLGAMQLASSTVSAFGVTLKASASTKLLEVKHSSQDNNLVLRNPGQRMERCTAHWRREFRNLTRHLG